MKEDKFIKEKKDNFIKEDNLIITIMGNNLKNKFITTAIDSLWSQYDIDDEGFLSYEKLIRWFKCY